MLLPLILAAALTSPEIGMFVAQSPQQWRFERDEPAGGTLTPVSVRNVVKDTDVSWVRTGLLNQMQRDPDSGRWIFPNDAYLKKLRRSGVKIFGTVGFSTWADGKPQRQPFGEHPTAEVEARWLDEVQALVAHHRGRVWIWQIGNEIEKEPFGLEVYTRLFESGSRLIRRLDPGVPIAAAGFSSGDFEKFAESTWPALLACEVPPDILDFHFHTYAGQTGRLDLQLTELREMADERLPAARLMVTENTTFTGVDVPYPWEDDRKITQSEADQAAEQLERAAIVLSHGASVSFGTDMDKPLWKDQEVHPFTLNGLVFNPRRTYGAARETRTWPKSAWWSLRLMTRLLDGRGPIDASHAVVGESAHLVTFRAREPVYLAWSDAQAGSPLVLDVPGFKSEAACVIEAVLPIDGKGVDPDSWVDRFRSRSVAIDGGRVHLALSAIPVWITDGCR